MKSVWRSLAWKEWHEHKWKLASIVAIMWGVTSLAVFQSDMDPLGGALAILLFCVLLLSVFVGLGAAASERSRATIAFLQALPVPIWRVALCKLFFGLLTTIVPIVLTIALLFVYAHFFESIRTGQETSRLFDYLWTFFAPIAGSLFIWSAAAGVNRKDEVSAGAVALAVIVGWWIVIAAVGYVLDRWDAPEPSALDSFGLATAPAGFVSLLGSPCSGVNCLMIGICTAAAMHLMLTAWYLVRFGRIDNVEVRSSQPAVQSADRADWLAPPRTSWWSATAWKQFRESGPIVLAGLAGVAGIAAMFVIPELERFDVLAFVQVLGVVTIVMGFAVALVVGIGIFLNDLTPRISTFWRSRPIHPDGWFWIKLLSGYAVFFVSFSLPLSIVALIMRAEIGNEIPRADFANIAVAALLLPLTIYMAAVAATCLVRHAVYAAILSIPLVYSGIATVDLILLAMPLMGLPEWNFREMTTGYYASGLTISLLVSMMLAWLAVRNDWGWKSRY